jgi:phosphoribosylformimino-5-aminoimidazole carboxamide ribotide isomerase
MDLYCAIDLRGGGAVRLLKGDYAEETSYGDPLALAESFIAAGTDWLHLVDLDAARDGGRLNRRVITEIASLSPVPLETGGGVRTDGDVDELLEAGVQRVIIGTAALEDPSFVQRAAARHPGHVAVGLDYRRLEGDHLEVAVRGWLEGSGTELEGALRKFEDFGVDAFIVTAIDRDGTLEGPDLDGYARCLAATTVPVIASGGVSGAEDLRELSRFVSPRGATLAGCVVGKALVEGRVSVPEAVAACR